MATLQSPTPKGRHWERASLPVITTVVAGAYTTPNITVDEHGRILTIVSGGGGGAVGGQENGVPVAGGPFNVINVNGTGVTVVDGGASVLDITIPTTAIGLETNGVPIAGSPHNTLNFTGLISVTDSGGGVAQVTVLATTPYDVEFRKSAVGTAASQNIGPIITPTTTTRNIAVTITVPYSLGATVEVQDGIGNVVMASAFINAQVAGIYEISTPDRTAFVVGTQFTFVVAGAPVAGAGVVDIVIERI